MFTLEKTHRNKLEPTITKAHDVAEAAAGSSLEQLGVGTPKPYAHLSPADHELLIAAPIKFGSMDFLCQTCIDCRILVSVRTRHAGARQK